MTATSKKTTPMMAQWHACKQMAGDAILLFRMGDFYEAFYEDAVAASKELELTLTQRQGIPMAGIPHHCQEAYVDRLVAKGFKVAIAEQMEDPKATKGLVRREVARVVTPGTVVNSSLLNEKDNNFLAAVSQTGSIYGLSNLDLTTGEFRVAEFTEEREFLDELYRLRPSEFLASDKFLERHNKFFTDLKLSYKFLITPIDEWRFDHQNTYQFLTTHFNVHSLDGFGLKGMVPGINASGALLQHLQDTLVLPVQHIREISPYTTDETMSLDRITQRNLELTESLRDGSKQHTLLALMDHTVTPMGARLLRRWIKQPLLSVDKINERLDSVQALVAERTRTAKVRELFGEIRDLERLMMKVSSGYAGPKDLVALRHSVMPIPQLKELLATYSGNLIAEKSDKLADLSQLERIIATSIVDEPPMRLSDGGVIREGYNGELDDLRALSRNSKNWLADYQTRLREELDIKTLRVAYTRAFGYYIEVTKAQSHKMPDAFLRRQTLVNNERYISPILKEFEEKILTAEDRMSVIENDAFQQIRQQIAEHAKAVLDTARAVSHLDCLLSLASLASQYNYNRPEIDESDKLDIVDGRHPVIESSNLGEAFIPNDCHLDGTENQLLLITGPNMAGKSTYIRQVALITIMAQMGSFVPAKKASIGIVDKVFTRIGASDDLSRGQSTFMVEMTETANILNNATSNSLVILDEIGRGTSTYDGVSIAWSVAEYLLTKEHKKARTLFATHYFELTELEQQHAGAVNYNVAVQEAAGEIVFLRKIVQGDTDKSYGIHVGRLAGLPQEVITRAQEVLRDLEKRKGSAPKKVKARKPEVQLLLFDPSPTKQSDPVQQEINALDLDKLTPLEALNMLQKLKQP